MKGYIFDVGNWLEYRILWKPRIQANCLVVNRKRAKFARINASL